MKMGALFRITRPHNCVLAGVGVLIGSITSLGSFGGIQGGEVALAFIAAALITGAGNVVNDYADRKLDSVNNPERPIPSGEVTPSAALLTSRVLFVLGIFMAALIGEISCLLLAGLNSALLTYYASTLKKKGLIGNFTIGYLVGSTFLFGGLAVGGFETVGVLAAMAGLSTTGRELIKDIEDIRGDRKSRSESFPLKFGREKAATLGIILTAFAIALTPLPYLFGLMGEVYLGSVAVSAGIFVVGMAMIGRSRDTESAHSASLAYKIAMGWGLIAFLLGSTL